MFKKFMRKTKKAGLSPGTLIYVGENPDEPVSLQCIKYAEEGVEETEPGLSDSLPLPEPKSVTWLNISGVHDTAFIERIGTEYNVHPLTMEDIVHTDQRPKLEDYENYLFVVTKMVYYEPEKENLTVEQISFVVAPNLVLSFQEHKADVFDPVRQRIRTAKGKIRKMGSDYLAYALIDAIVDNYFSILEKMGDVVQELDLQVMESPERSALNSLNTLKREMILLRKSIWPLREVINSMMRGETKLITKPVIVFLRDVYDHTIQVNDAIETYRDLVSGLMDVYLSSVSNRMNEVMKMLTIIATIFIPLTFLAGLYGMNFDFMPELHVWWAYPTLLAVMLAIAVIMLVYFKRKDWL